MKTTLMDNGFNVLNQVVALLEDRFGKVFFIHAKDDKTLNRLIKKCVQRGATLVMR